VFYTIYKTTNKINGKIYIGKHQTKDLDDKYIGSGKHLCRAIKKYGIENFQKEILFQFDTEAEMNAKEAELVTEEFCLREDTYNLCPGGHGGFGYLNSNNISKRNITKDNAKHISVLGNTAKKRLETDFAWKEKYRKNISAGIKKHYEQGGIGSFTGKSHSEEFKLRRSTIMKEKSKGSSNSQYGNRFLG
jgi:phosphopantetheinyl transferase (holo-ACP synthase)